tara:strand:+ start:1156 stop:1926 length:771 start_codon:yes stop_codon:yes gene_type:complete
MDLFNETVLITGAAGRIGSAIADQVLLQGGTVVLTDINKKKLIDLKEKFLSENKEKVYIVCADVTNSNGIEMLIEECLKKVTKIDSAIHSAYPTSIGWGTKFEDIKQSNLDKDLSMQLGGAIIFSQKILKYFDEQNKGNLIHISSIFGIQAPKFHHYEGTNMTSPIEYAAIKSGIISITRWLAKYYKNKNIRVNCISPGGILDNQPNSFLEKYRESCTNIGMLNANDLVSTISLLLSPRSRAINGQNIIIDDGWSL